MPRLSSAENTVGDCITCFDNNQHNERYKKELEALVGILKLKKGDSFYSLNRVSEKVKKTPFQLKVLKELYKITQFPSTITRNDLSLLIGIPQRSIQVWFQNTRQVNRRNSTEPSKQYDQESEDIPIWILLNIITKIKQENSTEAPIK